MKPAPLLLPAAIGAIAMAISGCAANHADKTDTSPLRVEKVEPPPLTPQQERDAFDRAMTEGMAKVEQGDFGTALGDFEQALALQPDSIEALIAMGACHESIGDPVEAIRHYRRALAINPLEVDAHANLGTAYIKLYHRENNPTWKRLALNAWRQSLALNPDQPDLRGYLQREAGGL